MYVKQDLVRRKFLLAKTFIRTKMLCMAAMGPNAVLHWSIQEGDRPALKLQNEGLSAPDHGRNEEVMGICAGPETITFF